MEFSFGHWTTPWTLGGTGLLLLSFVCDALLAPKYAGGSGDEDEGTWKMLFFTLGANMLAIYVLSSWNLGRIPPGWLGAVGLVVALLGFLVRYGAILSLGERFTWRVSVSDGQALAQTGVFRWIRHPSYAGGVLAMYGLILCFGSWLCAVLFTLSYLPLIVYRIRVEERVLAAHFGEEFRAYAARTARLVPFIY